MPSRKSLDKLGNRLAKLAWQGLLAVELESERKGDEEAFRWTADAGWQSLGRQQFGSSEQLDGPKGPQLLASLERILESHRSFEHGGRKFGFLNCGEIMVLKGRNSETMKVRSDMVRQWLGTRDIILNPTHTRMSPLFGHLGEKRAYLSAGKAVKCPTTYISSSNWETDCSRQQNRSDTPHAVFHKGKSQRMERVDHKFMECRTTVLSL